MPDAYAAEPGGLSGKERLGILEIKCHEPPSPPGSVWIQGPPAG